MSLRPESARQKVTAGKRNRRITLTSRGTVTGYSGSGAPIYGNAVVLAPWAAYMPVSDSEKVSAAEVMANLTARFDVAWTPLAATVDPTWTLAFNGKTFDILGAKELGHREGIEITAGTRAEQ